MRAVLPPADERVGQAAPKPTRDIVVHDKQPWLFVAQGRACTVYAPLGTEIVELDSVVDVDLVDNDDDDDAENGKTKA